MIVPSDWKLQLLVPRMLRAAALDRRLYNEVAADRTATVQALLVVVLSWAAVGIGDLEDGGLSALAQLPVWIVLGLVSWIVGTHLTHLIGANLLKTSQTNAEWTQLARAMGFAHAPGLLRVLGVIPGIGPAVAVSFVIWWFLTTVAAIRQALHYGSDWRAFIVLLIGLPFYVVIVVGYLLLLAQG